MPEPADTPRRSETRDARTWGSGGRSDPACPPRATCGQGEERVMEWRKRRRQEEPEHHEPASQPRGARREGVPEGSAKEFARGESHVADVTADRYDGLGKGFAHG